MKMHRSGVTEGRVMYHRLKFLGFEYRSDLIAHDYMRRWTLRTPGGFMLRLHRILRGDSDRHFHDHPFSFLSFILKGGYIEHRPGGISRTCRPGSIVMRRAEDLHRLQLLGKDAWTFVVTGPLRRRWGFMTEDGWILAGKYDAWRRSKESAGR